MPFIAYELDALNAAPDLARAAGITDDAAIAGLARLWVRCFRTKSDMVADIELVGCFGGEAPRLSQALSAFGFIENMNGAWRIKGADRYLRLSTSNSAGGKARTATASRDQRGRMLPSDCPAAPATVQRFTSVAGPATQPSHQTPNTKHQTPIEKEEAYVVTPSAPTTPAALGDVDETPTELFELHAVEESGDRAIESLRAVWNEVTSKPLARWQGKTPRPRKVAAHNALKRRPLEEWRRIFERIEASAFCRGENDRAWVADVDWALRPDGKKPETGTLVLEGKFDRAAAKETEQERINRLLRLPAEPA